MRASRPSIQPVHTTIVISLLLAAALRCGPQEIPPEPDPAAITVVAGNEQSGVVGQALADSLGVQVSDLNGDPVPARSVRFRLPPGERGSVDPAEVTTSAEGHAATRGMLGTLAGPWEVSAEVTTLDGRVLDTRFQAHAEPDIPDSLFAISGQEQSGMVGEPLDDSLTVRVVDRFRNAVQGVLVAWETIGGGTVSSGSGPTGPDGQTRVALRLGPAAGNQSVVASVAGLHGSPVTFRELALHGAPAGLLAVSGNGQTGEIGKELVAPLKVKVTDASGNPIEGLSVTWSVEPGSGSVNSTTSRTNAEGVAAVVWRLGDERGDETVSASVTGLPPVVFKATGIPPEPAALTIKTQPPGSALSGRIFLVQPVVEVRDQDGDLIDSVEVRASIEAGGGTLRGDRTVVTQDGVARFVDLSIAGEPGSRTIRFQAGKASAVSRPISVELAQEAERGEWSAPFDWPVVGVHLHLLPSGQVLTFGFTGGPQVWDQPSGRFTASPSATLLFCGGHAFMPDGRLLVTGGHITGEHGLPYANVFDPTSRSWTQITSMAQGRWYPTTTTLANGEMLTIGGSDANRVKVTVPEVWTGAAWRSLPDASLDVPWYPWMFQAPNGEAFYAGPSQATRYLDPRGTGSWRLVANTNYAGEREAGSAVMYEPGKILIVGGDGRAPGTSPTARAEIIDLNSPTPTWRSTGSMAFPRRHLNATLLPTGEVLVTGGTAAPGFNDAAGTVHAAELWDPRDGKWETLASNTINRIYHSAAVLLPDGRVLVTGAGVNQGAVNELNAELYSPPYLFRGTRPRLTGAPSSLSYATSFSIMTPSPGSIAKVTLLRLGSVTHSFDQNQRFISLAFHTNSTGLSATAPGSGNVAPPGHYLLFLVSDDGVPSVGRVVRIH
jgi:hypothetical protein